MRRCNTDNTDSCRNDCTAGNVPGRIGAGAISALVIDPQTPTTLYVRAHCGGVLKSVDGGATWSAPGSGRQPPYSGSDYFAGTLDIDPAMPSTLYAGVLAYAPVSKSTDGGGSWEVASTGLPPTISPCSSPGCAGALAIDPQIPSTLYAGGLGFSGVFKSTDGASSWVSTGFQVGTVISDLVIDPLTPSTPPERQQQPVARYPPRSGG